MLPHLKETRDRLPLNSPSHFRPPTTGARLSWTRQLLAYPKTGALCLLYSSLLLSYTSRLARTRTLLLRTCFVSLLRVQCTAGVGLIQGYSKWTPYKLQSTSMGTTLPGLMGHSPIIRRLAAQFGMRTANAEVPGW